MERSQTRILARSAAALVAAGGLFVVYSLYAAGQAALAAAVLGVAGLAFFVYTAQRGYTLRYLFPGLLGIGIFVVVPLIYTVGLGFTNYSSKHLLTFDRATEALLGETFQRSGGGYELSVHAVGDGFRLVLTATGEEAPAPTGPAEGAPGSTPAAGGSAAPDSGAADSAATDSTAPGSAAPEATPAGSAAAPTPGTGSAGAAAAGAPGAPTGSATPGPAATDPAAAGSAGSAAPDAPAGDLGGIQFGEPDPEADSPTSPAVVYVTPVIRLDGSKQRVKAGLLAGSGYTPGEPVPLKDIVARREALQAITVELPDGTAAVMTGLRELTPTERLYDRAADGTLTNRQTGAKVRPNFDTGFYETADGQPVIPGFRVGVGLANFDRVFSDDKFRGPFIQIFLWNVLFAALTVVLTVSIGMVLSELLSWESLRFRGLYRVLLFLPYAVPGFISILVFKGLFNQSFGEINMILDGLFGIRPDWISDATLAKVMILIVNTWLGYPYFMLLCMGLQKSIPRDLYEASALAGASPLTNFFKITWPLIRKPLMPLMVSSFAFNFNNFVLIQLLTNGRPDFINTSVPAGETDLLVTYTYRIAFQDSGQNFGLASAISTIIFAIVAVLSIINLRLTKVTAEEKR
jgi:maltose/maltodextrin transport system permease protein